MVISFSFFLVFSLSFSYILFDFNLLTQDKLQYPCLYCILDLFLINEVVSHTLALVYHTGNVVFLQANNFKILCSATLEIPSQQDLGQLCMAAWHGQLTAAKSLLPIHCRQVPAGQLHIANSVRQLFMGDQR
uniref:Uncharacterized protein n=1 Tax=Micrurus spixii TaxID=129469 RepID=A0A2D4L649_9SAUR